MATVLEFSPLWILYLITLHVLVAYLRPFFTRKKLSSQNKAVLITGCSSGFGFLLCQQLAKLGYKVFAGFSSLERKGAQELKSLSTNIRVLQLDVRDNQSVENAVKIVSEELQERELWAVVNNAGITHSSELQWTSIDTIRDVFDVNTFGTVRVTQQFLPLLKKSKGRIINVTSITAEVRLPGFVGYSMSKAAVKNFTDIIRLELKRWGIEAINVAPHFYGTKMVAIDNVLSLTMKEWQKSKGDLGNELEDEYFKRYKKMVRWFLSTVTSHHIDKVVECLEDAITSVSPKLYYYPGSVKSKLLLGLLYYLPSSLQDYIESRLMPPINKK